MAVCSLKKEHMPEDYQQLNSRQKREYWKSHVAQWQQNSLSQHFYSRENVLKTNHFYYWRRRTLTPQTEISFLPVTLPERYSSHHPSAQ